MSRADYPPMMGKPNVTDLTFVSDLTWVKKVIFVDGYFFRRCTFSGCTLVTLDKDFCLEDCQQKDGTRFIRGALHNGMKVCQNVEGMV